jgi:hypothetical protein
MIKEIDILDLRGALDKKISTLGNFEKVIIKFQSVLANLKSLEEQKMRELQGLAACMTQFYNKDCIYKEFTDTLVLSLEKEKLEVEQMVSLGAESIRISPLHQEQYIKKSPGAFG